ncbi:DUF1350 family protein [Aetokthonos hydrillicola Thurmond2011]|jgi:hypothetical protein|uniref:DUF1350 family protein n=1 Tax=Aetokthonos hydrillicola Thurmond2011 TaxID=2712845 RepID=A0AAP5IES3_9CYAN|nr:DUF1350 family protein [Aetokthonos hydrillicola]MBW4586910.1 DUF1350 family protein [Aetokthonos hydrillicola CCALA 1050]MDR9897615.1 DUF1350 family protein [Aetokthonos hydrillicola Thurmond2011]
MDIKLRFQPISFSWVALHPKPKGVIQFVGGAFFGTFAPMLFYRYLLECLFKQGYTIILLPFKFTFDHYLEAGFLIKEQYRLMPELVRMAQREGHEYETYLDDSNFSWIGHSIGCKYIALLEAFSALPTKPDELKKFIQELVEKTSPNLSSQQKAKKVEGIFNDIENLIHELKDKTHNAKQLVSYYVNKDATRNQGDFTESEVKIESIFIKSQPSLFLAPVNTGLESAIKPKVLADFIIRLGLNVRPTPQETYALIEKSDLFNLLGLISFSLDNIGKSTREWFINTFKKPPQDFRAVVKGGHLRPLGLRIDNLVLNFPDTFSIPLIESTNRRKAEFEVYVLQLVNYLEQKRHELKK